MYLSILFFLAPADRWMDDNWSQDQEKHLKIIISSKSTFFRDTKGTSLSGVWICRGVFKLNSFRLISKNLPSWLGPSLHFVQWHVIYNSVLSKLNVIFFFLEVFSLITTVKKLFFPPKNFKKNTGAQNTRAP